MRGLALATAAATTSVHSLVLYLQSLAANLKAVHLLNGLFGGWNRIVGNKTCQQRDKMIPV